MMESRYSDTSMSIYDYMIENNQNMDNRIAIDYLGRKFTFKEVKDNILLVMKSLSEHGLKKGDKISFLGLATPEFVFTLYAANKLGIIVNLLNPLSDNAKNVIKDVKPKLLFCFDKFYAGIQGSVPDNKIIITSPMDSLPYPIKLAGKVKNMMSKEDSVPITCSKWSDFIKRGKKASEDLVFPEFIPNEETIELGTGGSTGVPKQVAISNEMLNNIIYQHHLMNIYDAFDVEFKPDDTFLDIIPPHLAYGICDIHLAMSLNLKLCLEPDPDPKKFIEQLKRHKPAHVLAGPVHWKEFIAYDKKIDLSNLKNAVAGGEHLESTDELIVDDKLMENGSSTTVREGVGLTEICGVGTYNSNGDQFTVGRPLPEYQVGIYKVNLDDEDYDNTSFEDQIASLYYKKDDEGNFEVATLGTVGENNKGEICYQLPVEVLGYVGDAHKEETEKLLRLHEDGKIWVHTGDVGYIREDRNLVITDRIKRVFNRFGWKIYPTYLSELVSSSGMVKENTVIKRLSEDKSEGYVPILYACLKADTSAEELEEWCRQNITGNYEFHEIVYTDELPKTGAGKIDFKKVEQEDSANNELSSNQKVMYL